MSFTKNNGFKGLLHSFDSMFQTEAISEFRTHVQSSLASSKNRLHEELQGLSEDNFEEAHHLDEYRDHLSDEYFTLEEVERLADELSILALYKQYEIHIKKVANRTHQLTDKQLEIPAIYGTQSAKHSVSFDPRALPDFSAIDELRLLSNSIKHEGKVSDKLAAAYPSWTVGAKLENLGSAYERLRPQVKAHIKAFVTEAYSNVSTPKV